MAAHSRSTDEFREALVDLKSKYEKEAGECELSPENKRQCLESLKSTIESLIGIERDLRGAEKKEPTNVVQVLKLCDGHLVPTMSDFRKSFDRLNEQHLTARRGRVHSSEPQTPNLEVVSLVIEKNYKLDQNMNVSAKPILECFIGFESDEHACMVLGMKSMDMRIQSANGVHGITVEFVRPIQPYETRKTFRVIGDLLFRLDAIGDAYKKIGAVRQGHGKPTLSSTFLDKSWFIAELERAKAIRASGGSLDHNMYGPLRSRRPVDSKAVEAQITVLYNEECDILIKLREFQLNGIDFEF